MASPIRRRQATATMDPAFVAACFGLLAFVGCLILSPYYTRGDQEGYRALYEEIRSFDSWDAKFTFYFLSVGAMEPFYLVVVNMLAAVIDKDLAFSAINGLLAGYVSFWLLRRKVSTLLLLLLLGNAYLMVLFFSAERLKLALLLFTLAFHVSPRWRWPLFTLAVLTQFQAMLLVLIYMIWQSADPKAAHRPLKLSLLFLVVIASMGVVVSIPALSSYLMDKLSFYDELGWGGPLGVIKPLAFLAASLYYTRRRLQTTLAFAPLVLATYLVGAERLAIFAYFLFMVIAAPRARGLNLVTLATSAYFFVQGMEFVGNFIDHGHGLAE